MNQFVAENKIQHVIEFGFGDGAQLMRAKYPQYTGLDVSVSSTWLDLASIWISVTLRCHAETLRALICMYQSCGALQSCTFG